MNQFERMAAQRDELVAQAEVLLTRAGDTPLEGEDREECDRVTAEIESVNERHKTTSELDRLIAEGRVSYESGDGSVIGPQFQKRSTSSLQVPRRAIGVVPRPPPIGTLVDTTSLQGPP